MTEMRESRRAAKLRPRQYLQTRTRLRMCATDMVFVISDTFQPMMTLYLTLQTTPDDIKAAAADGLVKAVKWYPAGATTNSGAGVKETDLERVLPTLEAMAEVRCGCCVCVCVCVCGRCECARAHTHTPTLALTCKSRLACRFSVTVKAQIRVQMSSTAKPSGSRRCDKSYLVVPLHVCT